MNRTQFVEIIGVKSRTLCVTSGVHQGSVLGLVIFLCYINDIASIVSPNIELHLFADDCLVYSRMSCHEDQLSLNAARHYVGDGCKKCKIGAIKPTPHT